MRSNDRDSVERTIPSSRGGFVASTCSTGLVCEDAASPLRDSAGISPASAGQRHYGPHVIARRDTRGTPGLYSATVRPMWKYLIAVISVAAVAAGCASDENPQASSDTNEPQVTTSVTVGATPSTSDATPTTVPVPDAGDEQKYPDIVSATLSQDADGDWTVSVTLSSPYDTPERYADQWRVLDEQGNIIGDRPLAHDHATEQPFTRSTSGVTIPQGTKEVTIEAHDQKYGWNPQRLTVAVPTS